MNDDPLELFHEWVQGDEMVIATATADGRPSARALLLKSADERGFTFFTGYTSRKGRELEANPRAALLFRREGIQVRVEGRVERIPPEESDAYWLDAPCRHRDGARPRRHQSEPIGSRAELEAAVAAQPARARSVRSAGAATGSCRTRTSSGATATTVCTNVTCSGHARTAGSVYSCNREEAARRRSRSALLAATGATPSAAEDRRLHGVPGDQRMEPARRQAAGRGQLGDAHRVDRRLGRPRRLRQRALGRLAHRHPVHGRARQDDAEVAPPLRVRATRATRARTRFRRTCRSKGSPRRRTTATATR